MTWRIRLWFLWLVLLAAILSGAEGMAQWYVSQVLKRGRLIESDAMLGWKNKPNLDLVRKTRDGKSWRIHTGPEGYRTSAGWSEGHGRRVLILGDSLAFGEGVEEEERFDAILAAQRPGWKFANLGVMGFGTDQQFIAGRELFQKLHPGDYVVLITTANDFIDIQRKVFAGRPKPYFELYEGHLVENGPPRTGFSWLRDNSYLFLWLMSLLEPRERAYAAEDVEKGIKLYEAILEKETAPLTDRGVRIVVAYHMVNRLDQNIPSARVKIRELYARLSPKPGFTCLDLDLYLPERPLPGPSLFQEDGHWNENGNREVARVLHAHLGD